MNASELRLGNWVETYMVMMAGSWYDKDGNQHGQDVITEPTIRHKQIDVADLKIISESKGLATYRPILLTQEIVEKCGFKNPHPDKTEWLRIYKLDQLEYFPHQGDEYAHRDGITLSCDDDYYNRHLPHIKYLHQIQNLYFALTDKELNYKP